MPTIASKLNAETRKLLASRPPHLTLRKISQDTGLTKRWLEAYSANVSVDPGVAKIETLYEYLSKQKLQLTA